MTPGEEPHGEEYRDTAGSSTGFAYLNSSIQRLKIRQKLTKIIHKTSKLPLLLIDGHPHDSLYTSTLNGQHHLSDSSLVQLPDTCRQHPVRHSRSVATMSQTSPMLAPITIPESSRITRPRAPSNRTLGSVFADTDSLGDCSITSPAASLQIPGAQHTSSNAEDNPWTTLFYPASIKHHSTRSEKGSLSDTESGIAFLDERLDKHRFDPMVYFPSEIFHHILANLDIATINICALVSKSWHSGSNTNTAWRNQFYSNPYWQVSQPLPEYISWKELYKARHELEKRWKSGKVNAKTLLGHSDRVYCVYFDNEKIVTGSSDRTIKVWDYKTGNLLKSLGRWRRDNQLNDIRAGIMSEPIIRGGGAVSANTTTLTTATSNLVLTDTASSLFHDGSILCLYFDDEIMVTGSSDSSCIIWELPAFKPIKRVYRHVAGVLDICLDKKHIASCSKDSTISVWSRANPDYPLKINLTGHRGPVNALQLRGDLIVSAGGDALVKLWSISEGTCIRDFRGHTRGLACVSFSSDGKKVVSGGNDNAIRIWSIETGECLHVLTGHKSLVRSLHVHSNRIISGSYDQIIKVWDLDSGQLISDLTGYHGSWIFSTRADCRRIVSTSIGINPVILDFAQGLDEEYLKYLIA